MVFLEEQWPWLFDFYYQLAIIIGAATLFFFLGCMIRYRYRVMQIIEERANSIYILLISVYVVLGIYYVFFGHLNYDEGFEIYASNLVYDGKIPYIDFWYTHGPVLSYIYGIPQLIFGSSLYVGRLTSLFFGALTLPFTVKIAEKFGGKIGAVVALALMTFNLYSVYLLTYAKAYELNAFFIVLSLYFLFRNNKLGTPTKYMLSIVFMSLAAGVRQSLLILVVLLILYIIYVERKNLRTILVSSVTGLLTCGLIFLPFLVLNRNATVFNLYSFYFQNPYSVPYDKMSVFLQMIDSFLIVSILMSVGVLILLLNRQRYSSHIKFLYIAAFLVFVIHFLPVEISREYPVIIMPVGSILAGYAFSEIYRNSSSDFTRYFLLMLLTIMSLFVLISNGVQEVDVSGNKGPIQEVDEMATYIKSNTPKDGKILAFSTYIAVQADRELLPGFGYAYYTYNPDWDDEKTREYNAVNRNLLNQYIESRSASAILLTNIEKILILRNEPMPLIEQHYDLVKTMGAWGQYSDTVYLYMPKKIVISVQKSHIGYGETQTWTSQLPSNSDYIATLRWSGTTLIESKARADANGNAGGSFSIGGNLPTGAISLRVELASDPSTFEEKTFFIGDPPGSITLTLQNSAISYDNTQIWAASGFAPYESFVVTLRSTASPTVLVIGSGNADAKGEASGSFLVGRNLLPGDNILRIEVASLPSYYSESTFRIS